MKFPGHVLNRAIFFATALFVLSFGSVPIVHASYYEIAGSGTWSTFSSSGSSGYENNGNWGFSFDLPSSLSLSSQTNRASISSSTNIFNYTGLTTYQATDFQLNNNALIGDLVSSPGTFTGTLGQNGTGTFKYSGGITFGTTPHSSLDGFLFENCLPGCQTDPSKYGPDAFVITLKEPTQTSDEILLTSTTITTGNGLNVGSYSVDLNFDGTSGTGVGTLDVQLLPGQQPGASGGISPAPEPSAIALFGTGIFLIGVMACRREKFAAGLLPRI